MKEDLNEVIEGLRKEIDELKVNAYNALKSDKDAALKIIESVWGPQLFEGEERWFDPDLVEAVGKAIAFHKNKSIEHDICHHCQHEYLDFEELEPVEGNDGSEIEQKVACPNCKHKWIDVFTFSRQSEIK